MKNHFHLLVKIKEREVDVKNPQGFENLEGFGLKLSIIIMVVTLIWDSGWGYIEYSPARVPNPVSANNINVSNKLVTQ